MNCLIKFKIIHTLQEVEIPYQDGDYGIAPNDIIKCRGAVYQVVSDIFDYDMSPPTLTHLLKVLNP